MSLEAGAITARAVGAVLVATWPRRIVASLVLLVPVLVLALGGFREAPPVERDVPAGSTIDTGPLTIRPTAYFVSDELLRDDLGYYDAQAWLGVVVEVENVTDGAISLDFSGPASDAVDPQLDRDVFAGDILSVPTRVLRVTDATLSSRALPGVPTEVVMLWPLADPDAVEGRLQVSITEQEWTYGILSGEDRWLSLGDVWLMELDAIPLPSSLFEPEEEEL